MSSAVPISAPAGYVSKKRDARTTQRQYELMLDFMIRHPDIASGRHANTKRANYEKHWEELANVLNSDTAGPSKATTKWMKCWSDWKHNTRTKSAKIRQFKETATDGRFPCLLTSLEERLLKLMASFKNDPNESFNIKQENCGDEYSEYEVLGNWFSQVQYNIKKEEQEEEEAVSEEASSDDGQPFNTADFCIPVIDQDEDTVPNVEIKSSNGLTSAISIETWKKRKRLYSDTSSHSHDSQGETPVANHSTPKIIHIDTRYGVGGSDINDNSGQQNQYPPQQYQQQLVKDTLSRIAAATEQSAKANERCAVACERLANICERVSAACERTAYLNEKLLSVQERNARLHERTLVHAEQMQQCSERQVATTDQLAGMVQSVAEQSIDAIKKYLAQNSIRR